MDGFHAPDFSQPVDVDAHLKRCLPEATTRGMFMADMVEALRQRNLPLPAKRYQAFGSYPQREFITVAVDATRHLYPGVPTKEALRRLGQLAYPTFADTMIGKVMYGVLGKDIAAIMKVAPRGYEAVLSHGRAELVQSGPKMACVRLTDVATFLDCYQVGVFEGAFKSCNVAGTVKVKLESPVTGEFLLEW